jgi:hypothetical protein
MSRQGNLILGGILGGTAACITCFLLWRPLGILFPVLLMGVAILLGSSAGAFAADIAHKWTNSQLIILIIALFSGLITPICLLQILIVGFGVH